MILLSQTDRLAMLEAAGEPFMWNGNQINGVFEMPFELTLGVDSGRPSLTVDQSIIDLGLANGDTVTRVEDSAAYTVRAQAPDGAGLVRMTLEEQ